MLLSLSRRFSRRVCVFSSLARPSSPSFPDCYTPSKAEILQLRQSTSLPISLCKQALAECRGSTEDALEWLRKSSARKFQEMSSDRAGDSEVGLLSLFVSEDRRLASLSRTLCRTDFASSAQVFRDLCAKLSFSALVPPGAGGAASSFFLVHSPADFSSAFASQVAEVSSMLGEPISIDSIITFRCSSPNGRLYGYCHPPIPANSGLGRIASLIEVSLPSPSPQAEALARRICQQFATTSFDGDHLSRSIPADEFLGQQFLFSPSKSVSQALQEHSATLENAFKQRLGSPAPSAAQKPSAAPPFTFLS